MRSDDFKQTLEYKKSPPDGGEYGDPGAIRTLDLLLRRQLLYPAELRDQHNYYSGFSKNRQGILSGF